MSNRKRSTPINTKIGSAPMPAGTVPTPISEVALKEEMLRNGIKSTTEGDFGHAEQVSELKQRIMALFMSVAELGSLYRKGAKADDCVEYRPHTYKKLAIVEGLVHQLHDIIGLAGLDAGAWPAQSGLDSGVIPKSSRPDVDYVFMALLKGILWKFWEFKNGKMLAAKQECETLMKRMEVIRDDAGHLYVGGSNRENFYLTCEALGEW